jgi:flavin reductase (DIM6/NTAB) family NADH-FMN oxidoreductase RutF
VKTSLGARTIIVPTPVWVIAVYDATGRPNAMTASWAGVCCSQPPCLAVSLRKATYTYGCLVARRAFTVHVPRADQVVQADYLGTASGRDVDKLAVAGLTAVPSTLVDAPLIAEFPLVLECRLLHTFELGLHTQFIGEILDVKAEPEVLDERGLPDPLRVAPMTYAPEVRRYYGIGAELGQAKRLGAALSRSGKERLH